MCPTRDGECTWVKLRVNELLIFFDVSASNCFILSKPQIFLLAESVNMQRGRVVPKRVSKNHLWKLINVTEEIFVEAAFSLQG